MIPKCLSVMCGSSAAALGNHLWQSTLFAIVAWLLTLALRKNQARARYWVWLAASVKFLVPFSLLVGLGSHLASPHSHSEMPKLYSAIEGVSRPFTQPALPVSSADPSTSFQNFVRLLPTAFMAAWLCGVVMVLMAWWLQWKRIVLTVREATLMREGHELETLHRLESTEGAQRKIELLLSRASLEPGIFGVVHPVLIWPEGISRYLNSAQLEAIIAHELSRVRRRDNLAAVMHMLVGALFWFHPIVWCLGTQLVEEREYACDEEVLRLGGKPQVYAEGILQVCQFCLQSPFFCVSGVTGANLKKRIARIMNKRFGDKFSTGTKSLLISAGLIALAVPIVFGQINSTANEGLSAVTDPSVKIPAFEVASVRPNKSDTMAFKVVFTPDGLRAENASLLMIIRFAYGLRNSLDDKFRGMPAWAKTERFNIDAKVDGSDVAELQKLSRDQRGMMLQAILADRFKFLAHRESVEQPVYDLVIAKNGPKITEANPSDESLPVNWGKGHISVQSAPMSSLVSMLTQTVGRTVLDRTGLTGKYKFTLDWTPDDASDPEVGQQATGASPGSSGPSIFTAIQEELGLKLVSTKGPVECLVIDHVERPSEN